MTSGAIHDPLELVDYSKVRKGPIGKLEMLCQILHSIIITDYDRVKP